MFSLFLASTLVRTALKIVPAARGSIKGRHRISDPSVYRRITAMHRVLMLLALFAAEAILEDYAHSTPYSRRIFYLYQNRGILPDIGIKNGWNIGVAQFLMRTNASKWDSGDVNHGQHESRWSTTP
uniref:Transposase n=1 Tax=Panagrellus redivivus TaxID=6233 RepID=A0A7E4USL9_PANRE